MIQRMLAGAMFAGVAAGLLAALLHFAFLQPVLLLAERYESGDAVHFGTPAADAMHDHASHDHATPESADDGHEDDGHEDAHDPAAGDSPTIRNMKTIGFTMVLYVSYALMMVAALALAEERGHRPGLAQSLLWGLAGFAVVQGAPALGLAPELPGNLAADLGARQVWYFGTVIATAIGLAILAFRRDPLSLAVALVLLTAPHVIGAPQPDGFAGLAPPEVAAPFASRSLIVGAIAWAFLGAALVRLWQRPV
ncbi:MAG: CbtA family protein [Paracoccaceae bacterium]